MFINCWHCSVVNIVFILQPILTSIRGTTNIQQSSTKTANLVLQTKQTGQNIQRRITKPIVGKIVSSQRTQLPVDTVLGTRKLPGVPQGKCFVFFV